MLTEAETGCKNRKQQVFRNSSFEKSHPKILLLEKSVRLIMAPGEICIDEASENFRRRQHTKCSNCHLAYYFLLLRV